MASSSSSSSSISLPSPSLLQTWEYDVFTSFHGPDVRKTFLSHVRREFKRIGINMFIDDEMKRGEFIGPELKRAIRGSKIAVVLLSKNYASSSWCLDELVEIMVNMKESGQTVFTIFYGVEPTVVRKQGGDFGEAFKGTCQGKTEEKVQKWTKALTDVATITGYDFSNCDDEAALIDKIATETFTKLTDLTPSHDFDDFIGMESHMREMDELLRLDLDEVRMIGIWGPPGIGKTSIARYIFNQRSGKFQNSAFISDIRGKYPRPCHDKVKAQLKLQVAMLSKMFKQKDIVIPNLGATQQRLRHVTGFLVLDDVDQSAQLDALAKNVHCFGPKSRVIVITEDRRLLEAHGIKHIYKVNYPSDDKALEMFCMYAFKKKTPEDGFDALAREITFIVGDLPLALEVIGSRFRGLMSKEQWSVEVSKLRTKLHGDVESILKFSYDALCDEDKDLFLHIACFFNNENMEEVKEYLAKKFDNVGEMLQSLADKSLISINNNYIYMHKLLVLLGIKIVQSNHELRQRQFLLHRTDIYELLIDDTTMTRSVVGIYSKYQLDIAENAFEGIYNLEFLRVKHNGDHQNVISSLRAMSFKSPKIRLLDWSDFPMTCLIFRNNLEFLVKLRMVNSELVKLWDGTKLLGNLKWMDLSFSTKLQEIPNLSTADNLTELQLSGCSSLVELPPSIGNATNLEKLYLSGCSSLVKLPSSIGNATNLRELYLSGCSSLVNLPSSIGNATNLENLILDGCSSLVELPSSIGNFANLYKLYLNRCSNLVELPYSIGSLTNLYKLNLDGCSSLVELPSSIGNLTKLYRLYLDGCSSLMELPYSIGNLAMLNVLNLDGYSSLVELPDSIGNLATLYKLNLNGCSSLVELPSSIKNATKLNTLCLRDCSNLVSLPQLPDSLQCLDAERCESLEKLECSFCNPKIRLNFGNCVKLNQEARDLIMERSTLRSAVLPGGEVPACFTYRGYGSSVTVKLNQKPLPKSTKFKACISFVDKDENEAGYCGSVRVSCTARISNGLYINPILKEHLYIFEFEVEEEVTSTELAFEFELCGDNFPKTWEIKECGITMMKTMGA